MKLSTLLTLLTIRVVIGGVDPLPVSTSELIASSHQQHDDIYASEQHQHLPHACFSGKAAVQVVGRGMLFMQDVRIGDEVQTGFLGDHRRRHTLFQKVYGWGYRDPDATAEFVQLEIQYSPHKPLHLTPNHLVLVKGKSHPVRADSITVGDVLVRGNFGYDAHVVKVDRVTEKGLFAPLVQYGSLVANGLVVSSYASFQKPSAVEYVTFQFGLHAFLSHHFFLHLLTTPLRFFFTKAPQTCNRFFTNQHGTPYYYAVILAVLQWFDTRNVIVQVAFYFPTVILSLPLWMVDELVAFLGLFGFGLLFVLYVVLLFVRFHIYLIRKYGLIRKAWEFLWRSKRSAQICLQHDPYENVKEI